MAKSRFSEILKNIFFIFLILQFLPLIFATLKKQYKDFFTEYTKVGIVTVNGMITDTNRYAKQAKEFFKDPQIKAIVLKIDSPGGAPGGSQALFQEIKDLRQEYVKPVFAYTENICASGGYYIACIADHIVAQPASLVGSIGAYIGYPNFQDFIESHKIKYTVIQSGDYKAGGLMFKDLTPEQRVMMQGVTDDVYKQFVRDVASRRAKVASMDPKKWADGKIFTGKQAFELGLVDELGSYSTLEKALRDKASIKGEIVWVHPPKKGALASFFGSSDTMEDDEPYTYSFAKNILRAVVDVVGTTLH